MEKQDIFIVIVCIGLLFFWFVNQSSRRPPAQVKKENNNSETRETHQGATESEEDRGPSTEVAESLKTTSPETYSSSPVISEYLDLPPTSPITLASPESCDFIVDPEQGGITEIFIHKFKDKDGIKDMRLGIPDFPMFVVQNGKDTWQFTRPKIESVGSEHITISRAILRSTLVLEQSWFIKQNAPYNLGYKLTLKNFGEKDVRIEDIQINCGVMRPLDTTKSFMGAGGIDQRVDILHVGEDSPKTINIDKILNYDGDDHKKHKEHRIDWLAIQNKYFVSLVSGEMPFSGSKLTTIKRDHPKSSKDEADTNITGQVYLPKANLASGQSRSWQFNCYTGPKKYDLLKKLGDNEESILQFDLFIFFHFKWMKGISLGILWCLNKLEGLCHNYGVAIIIITLLIRTIFWPITHQTTIWSKKMQKIQPLAQEIREKYKSEPHKMQQKTMELYREHKINPVAGCLPMFLQIPVFFALFNVLRSAIELRQAGFIWAKDLSQQDTVFTIPFLVDIPINPLAILMGLTMVWQQKVVPTSVDPMQQKVMMFMTIFFVFILYSMPSGLTLYWSINQIVSIFQHKITRKIDSTTK